MATISLNAYETAVTVLQGASELNSLAHGSIGDVSAVGTGTILDNTTLLDLYGHFELDVGTLAGNPLGRGWLRLYMWTSLDATNFEKNPAAGAFNPDLIDDMHKVGDFFIPVGMTTTGKLHIRTNTPLPAAKAKFQLLNMCGQPLPSSGASVKCYRFNLKSV